MRTKSLTQNKNAQSVEHTHSCEIMWIIVKIPQTTSQNEAIKNKTDDYAKRLLLKRIHIMKFFEAEAKNNVTAR